MSRLAVGKDDHPEAAQKHLHDASALVEAARYDGAAYHAGYVVECCLKAVLLHDKTYDGATGTTDTTKLAQWHKALKTRPYGHDLGQLLAASIGPEGARYLVPIDVTASVLDWTETMRYWAPGAVDELKARAFLAWAEIAADSIIRMQLDGVL